jgi:SEC-C motif domain protein
LGQLKKGSLDILRNCPCKSGKLFQECCHPIILGIQKADTPEALMRSRYTAYSMQNIDYIQKTMKGAALENFNYVDAMNWAQSVEWVGLEVLNHFIDKTDPNIGYVEFKAVYKADGGIQVLHETSEFLKDGGEWFYVDGIVRA